MKEAIDAYLKSEEIRVLLESPHALFRDDEEGFVRITLPNLDAGKDDKIEAVFKGGKRVAARRILHDFLGFRYPRITIRGSIREGQDLYLERRVQWSYRAYQDVLIEGNPWMNFDLGFQLDPNNKSSYEVRYEHYVPTDEASATELNVKTARRSGEDWKWDLDRSLKFAGVRLTVWANDEVVAKSALDHPFENPATTSSFLLQEMGQLYSLIHATPFKTLMVSFPQKIDLASWVRRVEVEDRSWVKLLEELPVKATVIMPSQI